MKHKEAKKIKKEINKLRAQRSNIEDIINLKTYELIENCPHKKTKMVDVYISGTYYDKKQYIKKTICKVCGKEIDKKVTTGSYG